MRTAVDIVFIELSSEYDPVTQRCVEAATSAGLTAVVLLIGPMRQSEAGVSDPPEVTRIALRSAALRPKAIRNAVAYLEFVSRALARLYALRPRVVYAVDIRAGVVGLLASLVLKRRWILEIKELYADAVGDRWGLWHFIERLLVHKASSVVVRRSKLRKAYIEQRYRLHGKVTLLRALPPRVTPVYPGPTPRRGARDGYCVFLFAGSLARDRGILSILRGLRLVQQNVRVMFVGGGDVEAVRRMAVAEGVQHLVEFHGKVGYHRVLELAAVADVGIVSYENTTLNTRLCASAKAYDYIAMGLPILASNQPELVELVEGMGIGLTFDPHDPQSIARAMATLASDSALRETCRRREASMVENGFSWEAEKPALVRWFRELVRSDPE